jgi:hypothetical protein
LRRIERVSRNVHQALVERRKEIAMMRTKLYKLSIVLSAIAAVAVTGGASLRGF